MPRNQYVNITGAGTTVVKQGPGEFDGIIINTSASNAAITIYDSPDASGTKIGTINLPSNTFDHIVYSLMFTRGLTVVTSVACDITVIYS
jgi:hypothetical protein